jgi:hypothetical protein
MIAGSMSMVVMYLLLSLLSSVEQVTFQVESVGLD